MSGWRRLDDEQLFMQSPIGLRLRDALTAGEPLGRVTASLGIDDGSGNFDDTGITGVITPSSVLCYPGLGLTRDVGVGVRGYRVTLDAELYFIDYLKTPPPVGTAGGFEFNVEPYNDRNPPTSPPVFADVWLVPNNGYPYSRSYPVIRGLVQDSANKRIAGAVVTYQVNVEKTFTDARGMFSLPLRSVKTNAIIDARDDATGRIGSGTVDVTNPMSRDANLTITIH